MGRVPAGSLTGVRAGALAALLALAACAEARAGCGLSAAGHDPVRSQSGAFLDPSILGASGGDMPAPDTPAAPRPCSGPSCSGAPVPTAAPAPAETRPFEPAIGPDPEAPRAAPARSRVVAPSVSPRPVRIPSLVFHPPRRPGP